MSKRLRKYRIKKRLESAFLVASGIPAIAAVIALVVMIVVSSVYSKSLVNYGFAQGDVGKSMTYFAEARSALRGVIGYDEMSAIENMKASHDENVELFKKSFADLEKTMVTEENKAIYNDIADKLEDYWKLDAEIIELGATTDRAIATQAQNMAMNDLMPMFDDIYSQLTAIMDIKVEHGDANSDMLSIVCDILAVVIGVAIVGAMLLARLLGKNIADDIAKPMQELGDRLEGFAQGDLFSPFPTVDTKDEVADMIASANDMAESLDFIISDMEHILGKMADTDYTVRSKDGTKYIGDFRQLFDSSKKLRDCMVDTMHFIEQSSIQVTAGSGNLSETSLSLAEGATEQASAVEELQATITTIAEASAKAAENAEEAYNQSQEYADVANNSSADIRAMVDAMARINDASMKIGNIISEIESIASQTNLLSLNASIEAARAGEAGRGFSVVADQIRQLAEQSSKSAVDTRTLIEGAMLEIENGGKVAERAVSSIEVVVEGIKKVAESSKELSNISANQALTMKEAEEGINQISDVIQTNAAVAQQSSATSQELAAQAASLDSLIAKFTLPA
ncbi:MAG: methyl-accepting chemotaxis protein [Bacillus sp. (in: Bacteria)]|nr:methyl-accepting chemotaxis protein [Bacillus sp. (in: firmicutes)]MCM1426175.1 methyl-accepting chemotaxis protein [Eubacterium sp.]